VTKLPVVSGRHLVKALRKAGFEEVGRKGSHVSLRRQDRKTVVPLHRELARGTLLAILAQCGLSRKELVALLRK
jgi:predicted RNA binding protein YcfA (HicA-like mRNA interferase family)